MDFVRDMLILTSCGRGLEGQMNYSEPSTSCAYFLMQVPVPRSSRLAEVRELVHSAGAYAR